MVEKVGGAGMVGRGRGEEGMWIGEVRGEQKERRVEGEERGR